MARVPVAGYRLASMTVPRVAPIAQTTSAAATRESGRSGSVVTTRPINVK
jgi:hypothetical protein